MKESFKPQSIIREKALEISFTSLTNDFQAKFPTARVRDQTTIRRIWKKQIENVTVLNSKESPGETYSGRKKTSTDTATRDRVKQVLDRDALKNHGDANVSPVSSCRRNVLGLDKSAWWRIAKELKYHPYKIMHRQLLKPDDYGRRLNFCNWIITQTDHQLERFHWSDESNFHLYGHVNSQNVRRYAPLQSSD